MTAEFADAPDSTDTAAAMPKPQPLKSPFSEQRVFSEPAPPVESLVLRAPLKYTWETRPDYRWYTEYRHHLPYWQQCDPVPPQPREPPEIETPGETLTERQEAFCRAYVECPVAAKAARLAGYSPASAAKQASKLLKHPAIVRRIFELRDIKGKDHHVRRDTIIDQAEAVFEAAMEKGDYYAAMQALTMKARLAGFADYLPGVRILRREPSTYEQEFWARTHEAEQRLVALRYGEFLGAPVDRRDVKEAKCEAEARAETAGLIAKRIDGERGAGVGAKRRKRE